MPGKPNYNISKNQALYLEMCKAYGKDSAYHSYATYTILAIKLPVFKAAHNYEYQKNRGGRMIGHGLLEQTIATTDASCKY